MFAGLLAKPGKGRGQPPETGFAAGQSESHEVRRAEKRPDVNSVAPEMPDNARGVVVTGEAKQGGSTQDGKAGRLQQIVEPAAVVGQSPGGVSQPRLIAERSPADRQSRA